MKALGDLVKFGFGMVFVLMVLISAAWAQDSQDDAKLGDAAPPLHISKWVKGEPIDLAKGKGKTVFIVEFWATWCPPCRESIPHLSEIQRKYRDKNVVVVGITDEEADTVAPFVEPLGNKMDYTVAIDEEEKTGAAYMKAYGQDGIPTAFVVDKEGRVAWFGHPMENVEEVLDAVIAGTYDIDAARKEMELDKVRYALLDEFLACCERGEVNKAKELAEKMLKEHSGSADLMNQVAWVLLTHEKKEVQNPGLALSIAKAAMDVSKGKDFAIIDTYARALFMTGDVNKAIEQQRKAVKLAPDDVRSELQETLDQYLKGQAGTAK